MDKQNKSSHEARASADQVTDQAEKRRLLLPPVPRVHTSDSWRPEPRHVGVIKPRTARTAERRALRAEKRGTSGRLSKRRYKCGHCDVTCYGEANWRDHRLSRRHKNKVSPPPLPYCRACDREFESAAHFDRHLRGKLHLRVVNKEA